MKSTVGNLGRRLGCSVYRGVHTCHYLNCSPFDAQLQLHYVYRYRVGGTYLLPSSSRVSRDRDIFQVNTRSVVTRLPEFESTDNLLKTFFPLGQKKKGSSDNKSSSNLHHLEQLRRLVVSLHRDPALAGEVWKAGLVPKLIEFSRCGVDDFERQARMALSLVGNAPPYSGRGLRILSVDGGGTR